MKIIDKKATIERVVHLLSVYPLLTTQDRETIQQAIDQLPEIIKYILKRTLTLNVQILKHISILLSLIQHIMNGARQHSLSGRYIIKTGRYW